MRVLFANIEGSSPLPEEPILNGMASGSEVLHAHDVPTAIQMLEAHHDLTLLVANASSLELFDAIRVKRPNCQTCLFTAETMDCYSAALGGREEELVDHLVANRPGAAFSIDELRVTLQKLILQDFFGIEKYLTPGTPIHRAGVTSSEDRDTLNSSVAQFAENCRLGQHTCKLLYGISEELLMNAVYDAPVAGGRTKYNNLPRSVPIVLEPDEYSQLSYGCDGQIFAIAVKDPFGALRRDKLYQYIKKVLRRNDQSGELIDKKDGGAGLGLFKILYSCHSLVCNVKPGQTTEVIALLDINQQVRDFGKVARSVHFFSAKA